MPQHYLRIALICSLLLHIVIIGSALLPTFDRPLHNAPSNQIHARLDLDTTKKARKAETLLKNTLAENNTQPANPSNQIKTTPTTKSKQTQTSSKTIESAQRKIAEHNYYPEAAIKQGLEGEVRLILTLDSDGQIRDVQIAVSSGHMILDTAAVKAAYAAGRIPGVSNREIIIPIVFRLQ